MTAAESLHIQSSSNPFSLLYCCQFGRHCPLHLHKIMRVQMEREGARERMGSVAAECMHTHTYTHTHHSEEERCRRLDVVAVLPARELASCYMLDNSTLDAGTVLNQRQLHPRQEDWTRGKARAFPQVFMARVYSRQSASFKEKADLPNDAYILLHVYTCTCTCTSVTRRKSISCVSNFSIADVKAVVRKIHPVGILNQLTSHR